MDKPLALLRGRAREQSFGVKNRERLGMAPHAIEIAQNGLGDPPPRSRGNENRSDEFRYDFEVAEP